MLLIKVTQEHIDNSGKECNNCPIYVALREAGISVDHVFADEITVWNKDIGSYVVYKTPPKVNDWIIEHDDVGKQYVEPFEFDFDELEVVDNAENN